MPSADDLPSCECQYVVHFHVDLFTHEGFSKEEYKPMEMRRYRKLQRISYKDHVTNEEVRAKIQKAIGSHEDPLTIVKRRKLQWYGHISRSSGLAKNILQAQ